MGYAYPFRGDERGKQVPVKFDEFSGAGIELLDLETFIEIDRCEMAEENQEQWGFQRERLEVFPEVFTVLHEGDHEEPVKEQILRPERGRFQETDAEGEKDDAGK